MTRPIIYFLLFSNFCVLCLYALRWFNEFAISKNTAILDQLDVSSLQLYWQTMPKAMIVFLGAFVYLWIELASIKKRQAEMENILDAADDQ